MATAIQRRRGNTAQHANFTGLAGEITIDTDLNTIIVHDGSTAGGIRLAKYDEVTSAAEGDISAVNTLAGSGLTGGVTSGQANLAIDYENLTGNLVPSANNTYSLGSPTSVWKDLYVGAQTIFIDGVSLSIVDGALTFGGNAVAVANDPSVTTDGITEGNTNLYYTDARVDAHLSGGTGVTYANGTISIGQGVGTGDDVTFNNMTVSGNLTVSGTTTTVNTEELKVSDNIITLNSDYTGSTPSEDAGIEVERGDLLNVSVFWDESQDKWKFTNDGNVNYDLPTSTTDLIEGTNLYYTNTRVGAYIQDSITTTDIDEGTNQYFTEARARDSVSVTDAGGDGSLSYSNATGVFTYTGPSAAEVRAHFSAGTGISLVDGEIATSSIPNSSLANSSITINGTVIALGGSGTIDTDDIAEGSANLYYTDARSREAISVTDAGGDGSLSYSNATGVITYTGPSAAEVRAHFTGGTGVTITDGSIAIGQDVASGANVSFNRVSGLSAPTAADDAANKAYVDEVAEGLQAKPAVEVATTAELTGATYNNGNAGVGATLTSNTNVAFPAIDGVTLTSTTFGENGVLVKDQSNAAHNGRYNLTQVGDGSNPWILTRCGLCDEADEIPGAYVFVKAGNTLAGTGWVQIVADPSTFTVGTDNILVEQFSGAGTYTAGDGLDLTGTTFSVNVADGIAISGDNVILASSAAGTGISYSNGVLSIGQSVGTSDNVSFANVTASGVFSGSGASLTSLNASNISSGTLASARLPELVVGDFADAAIQTSAEAFGDSDTVLMTAAAVEDRILSKGYTTNVGDITGVTAGSGLTGGGASGSVTLNIGQGSYMVVSADAIAVDATSANTAGKVVARDGSGNFSAGVITATATQARYADVAERYEADSVIEPGTVVCFGGEKEITVCAHDAHHAVAGVISTAPAYLMNESAGDDQTHPPVALTGRVPCKVVGPVAKGDLMVTSSVAGHAKADNSAAPGRILGKAIGSSEGGEAVIEVLVTLM